MKKLISCIAIIMFFILTSTSLYAASVESGFNITSKKLSEGEVINFTLNLDKFGEIEKGINAYKATLVYEKNIFEEVNGSNFHVLNGWEGLQYNKDTGEFVIYKKAGTTVQENIVELSLRVKKGVKASKTEIKLESVVVSEGKEDISVASNEKSKINIDIVEEQKNPEDPAKPEDPVKPNNPNNPVVDPVQPIDPENPGESIDTPDIQETESLDAIGQTEPTINYKELPKTGKNNMWLFILFIIEVIIAIVVIYFGKKFIKNDKTKIVIIAILGILLSIQFVGTVYGAVASFAKKGELNGDGKVDYADVDLIASHLVNLKMLDEDKTPEVAREVLENADMNSDGKITVTDLSLLIQKIENKIDYDVELRDIKVSNLYPNKNEDITISFNADVTYEATIKAITINGNKYNLVRKSEEDNLYEITVNVGDTSGVKEYKFEELTLPNDKTKKLDCSFKVDVLKDKPTSVKFKQIDDIDNKAVTLTANIIDPDGALIGGTAELIRNSDNEKIATVTFKAGEVKFRIDNLELEKEYTLVAKITYDRDTGTIEEATNKNYVEDEVLDRRQIQLIADYELNINNVKTYKNNVETKYFEREEEVTVSFDSTNKTIFYPVSAVINAKEYVLERQENNYKAKVPAVSTFGPKEIKIEKIILNNTKEIEVNENNKINIEILKLRPTITNFMCTENEEENTINVKFVVNDPEETITGGKIVVLNENGIAVKEESFNRNSSGITLPKGFGEGYVIKVLADYDLDTNQIETGHNEYKQQELLLKEIDVDHLIEFKDISSIELYKQNGNNVDKLKNVSISDLNDLTKYAVKVNMDNDRSFYSSIREYKVQDDNLRFVLDNNQIVQYEKEATRNQLEVEYGQIEKGIAEQNDLENLINKIKANPSGTYNLSKDYNAYEKNQDTVLIDLGDTAFTGTINGNGHKIYNLNKPLFNNLEGATINNLIFEDVILNAATSKGTIANTATNVNMRNVHIKKLDLTSKVNQTAGFIGTLTGGTIEECSLTKFNVTTSGHVRIAGIVGYMAGGTIKNCYVEGKVKSTQSKDGNGIGSILGHATGTTPVTIENCISKVEYTWTGGGVRYNAGIIGLSDKSNTVLKNNVSLSTGTGLYKVHGSTIAKTSTNNYELEESTSTTNVSGEVVKTVSISGVTKEFFKNTAKFDENIWILNDASYNNLPTLKNDDPRNNEEEEPSIYIPDYNRIKKIADYKKDREIIYYNMYRLMPFYDAKYYVKYGNIFPENHVLNTKIIKGVLPYDENGKLILALSEEQKDKIKTIKILFTDNETVSYPVSYKKEQEKVVHYRIDELGIDYTFDKYLVNTQSNTYKYIVNQIKAFDYTKDLATLVEGEEVRTTSENYEFVKEDAENFAMKLLANNGAYSITTENSVVENKIKNELTTDKMLENIAYVYNYYNRYYNIEIGGINMSDIVFFDSTIFSDKLNSINMTNTYINTTAAYRAANNVGGYYLTYIQPSTGLAYIDFLEFFIKNLADAKYKDDPASWIIDNFRGTIWEEPSPRYPEIRYRVWDHLKARMGTNRIALLLSYRGDEFYLLGFPTTICTGNIAQYSTNKDNWLNVLKVHSSRMTAVYDTLAGVLYGGQGYRNMVNKTLLVFDSTGNKSWQGADPIPNAYKAWNEPQNFWPVMKGPNGVGGAAYGSSHIYFMDNYALTTYALYTHEAAHANDSEFYMEGTGLRGAKEHYTDNFLTQGIGYSGYGLVPNYTLTRPITSTISSNISKERINTRAKIESYYKGMMETYAYLDYIEAQAFLQLTPLEQSKIAQVMNESGVFGFKTEEDFRKMNLKTIEDIWDNRLLIIRGGKGYTTGSWWTIFENKNVGAPSKTHFCLNAYQFLGDFGYDGYVAYAGGRYKSKTDEEILRIMSGDDTLTFKKYQLGRYEKAKNNLDKVGINAKEAIQSTLEAMKLDVAQNKPIDLNSYASIYRESLYGCLKRITNDFTTSIYDETQNAIHIRTAEELVETVKGISGIVFDGEEKHPELNIILDRDIDFSNYKIAEDTQYMIETFSGSFDGNGHTIKGLTKPLFKNVVHGYVKNLNIENSNINVNYDLSGTFANTTTFSIFENINVNNVTMAGGADIGGLIGKAVRTTAKNIIANNVNVSTINNKSEIGGLFGFGDYSYIENVHLVNTKVSGNGNIGGIVGNANGMTIIKDSFNGTVTATGNQVGGIIGKIQNSTINNCYTLGKVKANRYVGGLVGFVIATNVENSYSNATITGSVTSGIGGLFGVVGNNNSGISVIKNNVGLGRVINGYKFDAASTTKDIIEAQFTNNYELVETMGNSTLDRTGIDFTGRVTAVNLSNLNNGFYTNTLKWDTNIWDLTNVPAGGLPKLKGLDKNNINTVIVKTNISTIEDFLKINEEPNEIYVLTKDLDFTGYTSEGSSIITQAFTGKIEGNNYKIKNLTKPLFNVVNGATIEKLVLENVTLGNANSKGSIANSATNIILKNVHVKNLDLKTGANQTAGLVGTISGGTIEQCSVTDFVITTSKHIRVAAIAGYVSNLTIKNCYVQGTMKSTQTAAGNGIGGIVGHDITTATGNMTIENCITKVEYQWTGGGARLNGDIIGLSANSKAVLKNNVSLSSGTVIYHVFGSDQESDINEASSNNYELEGTGLVSNAFASMVNTVKTEGLNKNFFVNTAKFSEDIWDFSKINELKHPVLK